MTSTIAEIVNSCGACEIYKTTTKQYGEQVSSLTSKQPCIENSIVILGPIQFESDSPEENADDQK